jgi:16S rRNA (guanine527-N7)-methyltransferase
MSVDPGRHLDARLEELGGLALPDSSRAQLRALAELLQRWGQRMNLTGHRDVIAILDGLIVEAVAMERELPAAGSIVDLGSGAGFPGLPLAVLRPEARVLLVDAREKRHHFQKTAIRTLELSNVSALRGRIEALDPVPAGLVIAQALAQPTTALSLGLPWCEAGGRIALPGSEEPPDPGPHPQIGASRQPRYTVPGRSAPRSLWLGQRIG